MEGEKKCIQRFCGKTERRKPPGRLCRRWENNIKMDLREVGWDVMDSIDLAKNRDRWPVILNVINLQVP
jgi:hypothetical protein